jgi:ligand-binding sensor domain-containing protein
MRKAKIFQNFGTFAGILLFLFLTISCERTNYELFDPASAGVWTLFDTSDGLPGNNVSDIKRDSKGNLWMTFPGQGIAKYSDGNWTYYRTSTSPLLLSNIVSCVAEASDGSIIFGTQSGVSILTGTNTFDSPLTTIVVTAVKVTSNGTVWIGTAGQGFYINSGSGFLQTTVAAYKNIKVNIIEEGPSGNIWLGTDSGLLKWNGTSFSSLSVADGLPKNRVSSLLSDSKKRLWIGTRGGKTVSWIDNNGIHQLSLLNGRDSCRVNDIFEDRSGNIWFATIADGLVRYDGIIPRTFSRSNGFPQDTINSIGEDKDGNLWFGLATKGVVRYTLPIN